MLALARSERDGQPERALEFARQRTLPAERDIAAESPSGARNRLCDGLSSREVLRAIA